MRQNSSFSVIHSSLPNVTFGPIYSRRFGKSLGIDVSPSKKQCNFDCLYCELAKAKTISAQEEVVLVDDIIDAIKKALFEHKDIDVLTVTANGEPTLYPYLDELIDRINEFKGSIKTLILSNASTINDNSIQKTLCKFDEVKLSLDCATSRCLKRLDRGHKDIDIEDIKSGMLEFAKMYDRELIVEILLVDGVNDDEENISKLNEFLVMLKPHRIDIGTIDRPPAYDVKPLSYEKMYEISLKFDSSLPIYIVSRHKQKVRASSYTQDEIVSTLAKRPLSIDDIEALFDEDSKKLFFEMLDSGKIDKIHTNGVVFYKNV
jgi:wyosine [tRNA(Phe)-imidazoG37] synthetase (radical SAM superfamily)